MGRLAVVVMGALLAVSAGTGVAAARTDGSLPAPAEIAHLVTNVPASALDTVGAGAVAGPQDFNVFKLSRQTVTSGGKPELLTMNFAWCPHCAANSWSLAIALSRFGTLTGLREIDTGKYFCKLLIDPCPLGANPCFPHTHGLSFLTARLRSRYLAFKHVVMQDVHGHNFQNPTRDEIAAVSPFAPPGAAPVVDVGGAYGFLNSGYSPGAIAHRTWSQIATSLSRANSRVARHVDGLANVFTAAICQATDNQPTRVCTSRAVTAAAQRLTQGP